MGDFSYHIIISVFILNKFIMTAKAIYSQSQTAILKNFQTAIIGLSSIEALRRLNENGKNIIKTKRNWHSLRLLANQLNDELVWILLFAALLALFFHEFRDAIIIGTIVAVNGLIGFLQEFKAEKIIASLKKIITDKAFVYRDSERHEIDSSNIVLGDIVFLASGETVPADGYLLESFDFKVNSFVFTGESKPRKKQAGVLTKMNIELGEIDNMVFMGETVAVGEATYVVTATGIQTELGKIATLTAEIKTEITPLQKRMRGLSRRIGLLSLVIALAVVGIGHLKGVPLYQNFILALAIAVSVVPEGLPAVISIVLSLGMKKLLKKQVAVKKLSAVETLGSVDIICTDKTGTITKNELMVVRMLVNNQVYELDGDGYSPLGNYYLGDKKIKPQEIEELQILNKIGSLCNSASLLREDDGFVVMGDPTEGAILVAGRKFNGTNGYFAKGETKILDNPFSSERMRMSVVYRGAKTTAYVKGSPEKILELSVGQLINGAVVPLTESDKIQILKTINQMSGDSLRVLAFAYRSLDDVDSADYGSVSERDLVWVGLMGMIDPPRKNVAEAVLKCKQLGIKVVMITGDYEITAEAIARSVGLINNSEAFEIINGRQLDKISDQDVYHKIQTRDVVFARISPDQKLRIASVLKNNGEIIAMTGDGVNDAPALKRADIGVAMGLMGTDVSKEASEIILLDDNFSSIIAGIEEGRTIYSNLRKFIYFIFTGNIAELTTIVLGLIVGLPAPLTAVQILLVDLGFETFPAFALGLEPKMKDGVNCGMSKNNETIISRLDLFRMFYIGSLIAAMTTFVFWYSMQRGGWRMGQTMDTNSWLYIKSTSAAYAALAMGQLANMLQARSAKYSIFRIGIWRNIYAVIAVIFSIGLLLIFMYTPFISSVIKMKPIDGLDWLLILSGALLIFLIEELRKRFKI